MLDAARACQFPALTAGPPDLAHALAPVPRGP